jgi:hypothetical protein
MAAQRFVSVAILAAVAAGGSLALRGVAIEPPTPKAANLEQLQRRIEQLEARVAELERHPPTVLTPRTMPAPVERMPPGSVPREFNGIPYYIIPVRGTPEK